MCRNVLHQQCALWKEQELMQSKQCHLGIQTNTGTHGLFIKVWSFHKKNPTISVFYYTFSYQKSLSSWNVDLEQWISISLHLLIHLQLPFRVSKFTQKKEKFSPKFPICIPQIAHLLLHRLFITVKKMCHTLSVTQNGQDFLGKCNLKSNKGKEYLCNDKNFHANRPSEQALSPGFLNII